MLVFISIIALQVTVVICFKNFSARGPGRQITKKKAHMILIHSANSLTILVVNIFTEKNSVNLNYLLSLTPAKKTQARIFINLIKENKINKTPYGWLVGWLAVSHVQSGWPFWTDYYPVCLFKLI